MMKFEQLTSEPILEPPLVWKKEGNVQIVAFSCGQAVIGDDIFVYYGGTDTVIGVTKISFRDIRF